MARWRTATRDAQARLAAALPQLSVEVPMSAISTAQLRTTLLGERPQVTTDTPEQTAYQTLRGRVHARLVQETAYGDQPDDDVVRERLAELVHEVALEQKMELSIEEGIATIVRICHDLLGLGPLELLLADPRISEVMVNGPDEIWIERDGKLSLSANRFEDTEQLMQVIDRIVSRIGRHVDETAPMVDARLEDGSRVNVVIPPVSLTGPTLTIRKFADTGLEVSDLIANGTATAEMFTFLRACVRARLNVVISGGTGSGKTTLLNVLSGFIPEDERIVTIEDAAELKLRQRHVISMETRPVNVEGRGQLTVRDLVINSLRMRPDRIVVGECRGGEALDMLQAMNTGHDGSLTTLHANSPQESISRLETMVLMAGSELPAGAIRAQIGSAIHVIVQQARLRDGSRRIVSIAEVCEIEAGDVRLQELFRFAQRGVDDDGTVLGEHVACGRVPRRMGDLAAAGQAVAASNFTAPERAEGTIVNHPRRRLSDWVEGAPVVAVEPTAPAVAREGEARLTPATPPAGLTRAHPSKANHSGDAGRARSRRAGRQVREVTAA